MRFALGFTLWELLCTLGIAAVAFGAGVPAFTSFLLDARLTADVNGWVLAVQLARSEAYKRGQPVVVCRTVDTQRCAGAAPAAAGWMVFVNLDDESPPQRSSTEPLLYVHAPEVIGSIVGNRPYYELRPGRRSTNGTTVFCDRRGAAAAKAVVVSYTGRPRVDTRDGDGLALRCPAQP
ncbi:MAG TPA: GspH/FimT family pseudopilin [Gammaproteobacteria bacterium]|nr:GspH/FimT family pseudopilin [Gammaproteobacteria bacterium]